MQLAHSVAITLSKNVKNERPKQVFAAEQQQKPERIGLENSQRFADFV
jgi:hypothetical protein